MPLPADSEDASILYQHAILCQTCIPYRDPGDSVRTWQWQNGIISLHIQAGAAYDAPRDVWIDAGLPYGPKPRLALYHLNAEALRTRSPAIELEGSLTAFVRRSLGLDPRGRNIRMVKDQLARLAAADFRFGRGHDGFELWVPKNEKQCVRWPTRVQFSQRYFESLMQHAVPLKEAVIARLSHSAMALDVYTWLAQRFHRIDPNEPAFVPWVSLKEQFGHEYGRMDNFRRDFKTTLKQVLAVYREALLTLDGRGIRLHL